MNAVELSVLMISADPGLVSDGAGTGDVLERHKKYARYVTSLDIVVFGGSERKSIQITDSLTVHATGVHGIKNVFIGKRIAEDIARKKKISAIVTQDPHATGWIGAQLKRKFSIPFGAHLHGDFWKNSAWARESLTNRIKSLMQTGIVLQADMLRVVSHGIEKKLIASGISEKKIRVVHTPVNDQAFTKINEAQRAEIYEINEKYKDNKVIIFVGRLVAAKNIPFMLEVIEELRRSIPEVKLLIIGKGQEEERIRADIDKKDLKNQVSLLGAKDLHELAVYYSSARLLLLLSTNESFGKVIIEAGFSGIPTLSSRTTGASEIIENGTTGFLVPINDKIKTVEVLHEMLRDEIRTKQFGSEARNSYLRRFSTDNTIESVIKFWKELAER